MQTYLANLNTLLLEWYGIIMQRPLYTYIFYAAIAGLVIWLFMIVYYKIKLASLRKKLRKTVSSNQAEREQLQKEIDHVNSLLQQLEIDLGDKDAQLTQVESDRQAAQVVVDRAVALEQQAKQLIASIKTDFYLPSVPSAELDLSQQLGSLVHTVVERLKSTSQQHLEVSQAHKLVEAALLEREAKVQELLRQLETQTALMQSLEAQVQAQQANVQQYEQMRNELQAVEASYQASQAKIAQLEAQVQQASVHPQSVAVSTPVAAVVAPEVISVTVPEAPAVEVVPEAPITVDERIETAVVESFTSASVAYTEEVVDETPVVPVEVAAEAEEPVKASGLFGALKNLGAKKAKAPAEPTHFETEVSPVETVVVEVAAPLEQPAEKAPAKLSSMFGSLKGLGGTKKSAAVQEEVAVAHAEPETAPAEKASATDKWKNLVSFKKPAATQQPAAKEVVEDEPLLDSMVERLEASNLNNLVPKKLKDIYHKIMSV